MELFSAFLHECVFVGIMHLQLAVAPVNRDDTTAGVAQNPFYQQAKLNLVKTLMIVTFLFVVCWSCNTFLSLLFYLGRDIDIYSGFYRFSVVAAFANCCVNPFVYAAKYKEFQTSVRHLFGKVVPKSGSVNVATIPTPIGGN
jgi:hypothetical protein